MNITKKIIVLSAFLLMDMVTFGMLRSSLVPRNVIPKIPAGAVGHQVAATTTNQIPYIQTITPQQSAQVQQKLAQEEQSRNVKPQEGVIPSSALKTDVSSMSSKSELQPRKKDVEREKLRSELAQLEGQSSVNAIVPQMTTSKRYSFPISNAKKTQNNERIAADSKSREKRDSNNSKYKNRKYVAGGVGALALDAMVQNMEDENTEDENVKDNLLSAVKKGDVNRVKKFLPQTDLIDLHNALKEAIKLGNMKVFNALLPKIIELNYIDQAFYVAIELDNMEVFNLLLPKVTDFNGALKEAVFSRRKDMCNVLLGKATDLNYILRAVVFLGDIKMFKELLPRATDFNDALVEAVGVGNMEMFKELLPKATDFNYALEVAVFENRPDMFKELLPRATDFKYALDTAVLYNRLEMFKELLSRATNFHYALQLAVRENRPDMFKILLSKITSFSDGKVTNLSDALDLVIRENRLDMLKILLNLKSNDLEIFGKMLKKIRMNNPQEYKQLLEDNPVYKEAVVLSSFNDRDWVMELLQKGKSNNVAKTKTEQLWYKYFVKNPEALEDFVKEVSNDKQLMPLIGYYPAISSVVHGLINIEKDDEAQGYETFVHGRNWEWNFVNDVWNVITGIRDHTEALPRTIVLRQHDSDVDVARLQRARKKLIEEGVTGEHLISSTSDQSKDENEGERSEVTFMNYTGASHFDSWPECSMRYCLQDHSATGSIAGYTFAQQLIQKYGLQKYHDQFEKLYKLHRDANQYGELLAISIKDEALADIVYPARPGGYKLKDNITTSQAIQKARDKIADMNDPSLQRSSQDEASIFCAAALSMPGEGEDVCKIRSINLADPKKYEEYEKELEALFKEIQKDQQKK